jgi:uncharacterized SAM-binding protein YcdF (DUF218 family)
VGEDGLHREGIRHGGEGLHPGRGPAEDAVVTEPVPVAASSAPPRRWGRRVLLALGGSVLLLALVYYAVALYEVWCAGKLDEARNVDAIVVLGAAQYDGRPSPLLATRLEHALSLYRRSYAGTIVVTGGKQLSDRFTEAEVSAGYLAARGIPEPAILQETSGRSSWESLESVARLLRERRLTRVLLVSDPSHSMRIKGIAEELGLEAFTSPTVVDEPVGRLAKEATGVALGRIIGYGRLGELSGCAQCASLIGWARAIPMRWDPARSPWRPASRPSPGRQGAERRSPSP